MPRRESAIERYDQKSEASAKNVSNKKLTYQSSNKKVIRIDKKGMLQAVKPGTARITVMAADGSKKKVVVKIVVKR